MSVWKLRVGAENYYLSQVARGLEDYYAGRGEMPGRWVGAASSGLGLGAADTVTDATLTAVMAGLSPGTGESPNGGPPKIWKGRVPGFDLTFAVPKSVSILYALGDPLVAGEVVDAVDHATEEALAWLEREACFVRRGSNNRQNTVAEGAEFGTRRLVGAGFVAAAFRHRTSRASDPHLHTHVLVANMTRGPDGRWTALDAQAIYRSRHAVGTVFQSALRHHLTQRLGVGWRPAGKGLHEVAGVPEQVIRLYSKRHAEIEEEMAAQGVQGQAAANATLLATRTNKEQVDIEFLRERWAAEAAEIGFDTTSIDQLVGTAPAPTERVIVTRLPDRSGELVDVDVSSAGFASWIAGQMATVDSAVTRHQITELVAHWLPADTSAQCVERVTHLVLASDPLVATPTPTPVSSAPAGWEQRWTSHRLLDMETVILAALDAPRRETDRTSPDHLAQVLAEYPTLGADQAAVVTKIATSTRAVDVVVGRAGTGKTFTMNAVRRLLELDGHRVVGVAPSARAARELTDGAGIDSYTFPRFALHVADNLSPGDVVVIDEAGMAGTVDLHSVITAAARSRARVILVGDHHQLPEVNAGGGFAAAVETAGTAAGELTINRRQEAGWEHVALDHLRHGRPLDGLNTYRQHGHVHLAVDANAARQGAVDAWCEAHQRGVDAVLLAGTRSEAAALNRLARTRVAGELHGPSVEVAGREFQVGDRVVLLRNANRHEGHLDVDTGEPATLDNGMIATITALQGTGTLDVELLNGRRLRIDAAYVHAGHVDHGYATTIHKAQGLTCDQMFLVGPAGLYREAVYVAMSRARHGSHIHVTSAQYADLVERSHTTGIPLPTEHADEPDWDLKRAITDSRAKVFALTHDRHLQAIAHTAADQTLDRLWERHVRGRHAAAALVRDGYTDPTISLARAELARTHRRFLADGVRVNAADWDNIGTVIGLADHLGVAAVQFVSADGARTATKFLPWADIRPVDNPAEVEITPDAQTHLDEQHTSAQHDAHRWAQALTERFGIDAADLHIVPAAIEIRRGRLTHQLAGDPPDWLTNWLGPRPPDPVGAQVWDDELGRLAAWRDARHIPRHTPAYGPRPDDPRLAARWAEHMDRALDTRAWLRTHSPTLETPTPAPVDIAAVRERLEQLSQILASAPADQRLIIDAIYNGDLTPAGVHQALTAAADTQQARRDWILEHWPEVVEHAELTRISNSHDPLAHWPTASPDPYVTEWLGWLQTHSADTPEPATLVELHQQLDAQHPAAITRRLRTQLAAVDSRLQQITDVEHLATPEQLDALHQHRHHLHTRRRELHDELARDGGRTALWEIGATGTALRQQITRRANHLAHQAIHQPADWVINLIDTWLDHHPDGEPEQLHQLVTRVAGWRERANHTGPQPLPSNHPNPDLAKTLGDLVQVLAEPEPMRIDLGIDAP